jgi:hypothetical protein
VDRKNGRLRDRAPPITSRGWGKKRRDNDFQAVEGEKSVAGEKEGEKGKASKVKESPESVHKASLWEVSKGSLVYSQRRAERTELEMRDGNWRDPDPVLFGKGGGELASLGSDL